jgi:hypothetical protein
MAQKYKRQVRKERQSGGSQVTPPSPTYTRPIDFSPDYGYIFQDLRRIAILAGIFLAILIALSFIL